MLLNQVDSIQELEAERKRLQSEADFAQHALLIKLDQSYRKGKIELRDRLSIPMTVAAVASLGAQHLAPAPSVAAAEFDPIHLLDDLQSSLKAYEEKSQHKWLAFLPLVSKLISWWQHHRREQQAAAFQAGSVSKDTILSPQMSPQETVVNAVHHN